MIRSFFFVNTKHERMVYRRKRPTTNRRKPMRPIVKRRYGTRSRIRQNTHYIKRTVYVESWQTTGAVPVLFGQTFQLSDVPNATDFTNVFDQYKLAAVKVEVVSRTDTFTTGTPAPNVLSIIDYNDATAPANIAEMQQYQSLRMTRGRARHVRYFKPKLVVDSANTSLNMRGWVSTSNSTVPHYALKWAFDASTATIYSLRTTYYLAFRTVK